MKTQSDSSLLSSVRSSKGEKILEVDGTVTTQPVLEHVGISTWPGRLMELKRFCEINLIPTFIYK